MVPIGNGSIPDTFFTPQIYNTTQPKRLDGSPEKPLFVELRSCGPSAYFNPKATGCLKNNPKYMKNNPKNNPKYMKNNPKNNPKYMKNNPKNNPKRTISMQKVRNLN